ncbi:MAG: chemotaxis protein CheC [Gemmatimonadota bacterium]
MDVRGLTEIQYSALREIANIGAGHAATALSDMTTRAITVSVPEVKVVALEDVSSAMGDPQEPVSAVVMKVLGDVTGRTLQLFPAGTAAVLVEIMGGRKGLEFPRDLGPAEQSILEEVGNIIVGAYLNALSEFMGMLLIMSVPSFAMDMVGAVLSTSYVNFGADQDFVFVMNTDLMLDGKTEMGAHFLLIPDDASLEAMLRALRLV